MEGREDEQTKRIALELQTTTKTMAQTNFTSALRMKNDNVKQVHFEMAIQQATFKNYSDHFFKEMGWGMVIHAALDEQKNLFNIIKI